MLADKKKLIKRKRAYVSAQQFSAPEIWNSQGKLLPLPSKLGAYGR